MIEAMRSLGGNQFEVARWYEKNRTDFKTIRVAIVTEDMKRWNTVISNLITQADSTMLLTNYAYPYATRQHIFYRGKWWEITNVGERDLDVNPQSMSLVKSRINRQSIIEMIEVDLL